jgi:hypothetical protein
LQRGPADSQAVRTALLQYVESGGTLLVMDAGSLTLPGTWQRFPEPFQGVQKVHGGFGVCLQIDSRDTSRWNNNVWNEVLNGCNLTAGPFQADPTLSEANTRLPIIEDLGLPIRGLFILMVLFAIGIGPVNLWLLSRWKRRIWLLWTVPAVSLFTCTLVFGYMIVAEGWQGRSRVVGFTILDEAEQRATTLGRSACYSPLTPGDGLHFGQDTEVIAQGMADGGGSAAACDIDWTRDQHLRRGWVSARIPAHFQLRRCEAKRLERLPVTREADGSLHVTNQLGSPIRNLTLADEQGTLYTAGEIGVGQSAPLTRTTRHLAAKRNHEVLRRLYSSNEWAKLGEGAQRGPENLLAPRTYLVQLASSPFLDAGLAGAAVRPTESYVLGLMGGE